MQSRLLCAAVAVWSLAACSSTLPRYPLTPGAEPTGFYKDAAHPELALLEYRIAKYLATRSRAYGTICAAAAQPDRMNPASQPVPLDPAIERKLLTRFPALAPLSRCTRENLGYSDEETGAAAAVFDVHELVCEGQGRCSAWGGYYANGPHGWSYYSLSWSNRGWRIKPKDLGIVLTGRGA